MISRIQSRGVLALLVSFGLLIGACGSPSSSTAKASPSPTPTPSQAARITTVDPCSLVTVAEASTVTGTPVTNLSGASGAPITGICIYGSADGKATVLVFAQAYPDATAANAVSPEQLAAAMNGAYGISNAKTVTGIGDKAVEYSLSGAQGSGIVIFAFKANVVFMIAVIPSPDTVAIEKLAATAAGRIH